MKAGGLKQANSPLWNISTLRMWACSLGLS
jgi:hypothetical protein